MGPALVAPSRQEDGTSVQLASGLRYRGDIGEVYGDRGEIKGRTLAAGKWCVMSVGNPDAQG